MVVIIVTMKMEETQPIYCSIRGLDRLNAVDPARYLEVKTKLGLAVAPYPGQVTFVEKTAEEVLRVLTEDLWRPGPFRATTATRGRLARSTSSSRQSTRLGRRRRWTSTTTGRNSRLMLRSRCR